MSSALDIQPQASVAGRSVDEDRDLHAEQIGETGGVELTVLDEQEMVLDDREQVGEIGGVELTVLDDRADGGAEKQQGRDREREDEDGSGDWEDGSGEDDESNESDEDGGSNDGDGNSKRPVVRTAKTKEQRKVTRGKKAGNPGRFQGDQLKLLETFVEAYLQIPKGTRGKNARLLEFWHLVGSAFWSRFTWQDARKAVGKTWKHMSQDDVLKKTNSSIKSFFRWRAKSSVAGTANPWRSVLGALRTPTGPAPRLLPAWQIYHSQHSDAITKVCNTLEKEGRTKKKRIALRNEVAQQLFERLSPEDQAQYETIAKERVQREVEVYRKALEATPSTDPADQLEAKKRLSAVVTPLLKLLSEYTGLPCLTLLAGQAEKVGTEHKYEVYSMHWGKSLEVVPRDFAQYDPDGFKGTFLGHFARFLRNCPLKVVPESERPEDIAHHITLNPLHAPEPNGASTETQDDAPRTTQRQHTTETKRKRTRHQKTPDEDDTDVDEQEGDGNHHEDEGDEEDQEDQEDQEDDEDEEDDEGEEYDEDEEEELPIPREATPALCKMLEAMGRAERNEAIRGFEGMTAFDFERECTIARNKEAMQELGLWNPVTKRPVKSKRKQAPKPPLPNTTRTTRSSARRAPPAPVSEASEASETSGDQLMSSVHSPSAENAAISTIGRHDSPSLSTERTVPTPSHDKNQSIAPEADHRSRPGSPRLTDTASPNPSTFERPQSSDAEGRFERTRESAGFPTSDINTWPLALPEVAQEKWLVPFFEWLSKEPVPLEARVDWMTLLHNWVLLEFDFNFVSSRVGLPRKNRPEDVDLWIKNARSGRIVFKRSHMVFETQWFKWWDSLNPAWRVRENGRLATGVGSGSWDGLLFSGTNGFLNVIASLTALREASTDTAGWVAALKDVCWVVGEVLAAKKTQRERVILEKDGEDRPSKRRRIGA